MHAIASRLLLRLALVAASLAWAAFVFTNTIGDPGRGERIAAAVLDDPDARAEITAPITDAVLRVGGLPPEQEATVVAVVDQVLRDPAGAQAFIDPFAASWARLLGEDDPRSTDFDLARIVSDLDAAIEPLDLTAATSEVDRLVVPSVPLPQTQLEWMGTTRRTIDSATLPLAAAAVALAAVAFAIGDRRRVVRRVGVWAIAAGLSWVIIPPLLAWAARSWAPGADAVVSVSLDEATGGMRAAAIALVVSGVAAVVGSLLMPPPMAPAPRNDVPVSAPPIESAYTPEPTFAPTHPVTPPAAPSATPAGPSAAQAAPTEVVPRSASAPADRHDPPPQDRQAADDGDEPTEDETSVWDFYSR